MNAKVVLFSHSISADIVPNLFVVPFINRFHKKVYKVFLNHGTVGFKKRLPMKPKLEKITEKLIQSYDLNICDSEFEKAIKRDDWKIDDEKIKVTGYPRYDKLYDIDDNNKSILFMPTWRNWIRPENTKIEDTEYFENIIGLITNKKLISYLEEQGMQLSIYIHQLMQAYLDNFKKAELNKNVIILPIDADITEELMKAELLITDYSSVAYDFYYMNKPILFFQFDKEEYQQKVGSYVDLDNGLFGQPVYTMNDCVNEIIEISKRSFQYDKKYEEINEKLRKKYLKYEDKENCERIYEIIKDGLCGK
jgi:CDP-glycerol glycerophosphotransferase (TagB/SpsB family)